MPMRVSKADACANRETYGFALFGIRDLLFCFFKFIGSRQSAISSADPFVYLLSLFFSRLSKSHERGP